MNFRTLQLRYWFSVFVLLALFLGASVNVAQAVTLNPAGGTVAVSVEQGASKHVTLATIINDGAPATFNVTAVLKNASWLTIDASTATGVSSFLLSGTVSASGLAVGTYNESVIVQTNDGDVVVAITLTVTAAAPPVTNTVTFSPADGSTVQLSAAAGTTTDFYIGFSSATAFSWAAGTHDFNTNQLFVTLEDEASGEGVTAASVKVHLDATNLTPSSTPYEAQVTVTTSLGSATIKVKLTVTAGSTTGAMTLSPSAITPKVPQNSTWSTTISLLSSSNFQWFASSSASWLTIDKLTDSGKSSYTPKITVDTNNMFTGTYTGKITFTSGQSVQTLNATLTVSTDGGSNVTLTPSTLNPVLPVEQQGIYALNLQGSTNFGWSASTDAHWLSLDVYSEMEYEYEILHLEELAPRLLGVYPIQLTVDAKGLLAGNYTGHVYFATDIGGVQTLTVNLKVMSGTASAIGLSTDPPSYTVNMRTGTGNQTFNINLKADDDPLTTTNESTIPFSWNAVSSQTWLNLSKYSESDTKTTHSIAVTIDESKLQEGVNNGIITFISGDGRKGSFSVTVNYGAGLAVTPSSVNLTMKAGKGDHYFQVGLVSNDSQKFSWVAGADKSWVKLEKADGTEQSSGQDSNYYAVGIRIVESSLSLGSNTGTVTFTATDGRKDTLTITVTKTNNLDNVAVYPSSVNLTAIEGSDSSVFNIVLYGSDGFSYGVGVDRNWLSVEEETGTGGGDEQTLKNVYTQAITVSPGALKQGTYNGTVYFTFSDGQTRTVAVNLTVTADPAKTTTFMPSGAIALEAGTGQIKTVSAFLMGKQFFSWAATSDVSWLTSQPSTGTMDDLYSITLVANAANLLPRSEPYVGKLTFTTSFGTTHEVTVALTVTVTPSTSEEPFTSLTYNTSSWLNLVQSINIANLSGRLFILMEHPQLVPYQQYAYRIGPYGPQLDLFSKWGRTVPNALDLAYASDVKTVSKVVIGGYRMSGLEGNLVVKLMVGNNVNNLSEIKRWNINIMPLEGEWAVSDRFNGEWIPYPKPLILEEKRTVFNSFWNGAQPAVSYGESSTQLGSNFRICGTGAEMFCFNGPSSSEGDSSYLINLPTQMAEIQHRVEWYEPTSMQGKWRYRWWGYDAWSVEQPFVALRTDLDISELVNSSNMPGARGELEIGLHWTNYNDIDLHVVDPSGETVYYGNTTAASGGMLDVDSNAACSGNRTNDAWEHIVWVTNPPTGQYKINVNYYAHCDNAPQSSVFNVIVKKGEEEQTFEGAVSTVGQTVEVATITY